MINKLFAGAPRGCQTAPTNFITRRLLGGGAEMLWSDAGHHVGWREVARILHIGVPELHTRVAVFLFRKTERRSIIGDPLID